MRAKQPSAVKPFGKNNNVGLHHLAIRVADPDTLEKGYLKPAAAENVDIEFVPEPLRNGPATHTIRYEAGGIDIEFTVAA